MDSEASRNGANESKGPILKEYRRMEASMHIYQCLARILEYPAEEYMERLEECRRTIGRHNAGADEKLAEFMMTARELSLEQLQERYTLVFDLNPQCTLDAGFHIFGESYKRGAFLAELRGRFKALGITENSELPDHLTNILRLLAVMTRDDEYRDLMRWIISPSLSRMLKIMDRDNMFSLLLESVEITLRQDHEPDCWYTGSGDAALPGQSTAFLGNACPGLTACPGIMK